MRFPDQCVCVNAGQCRATGREMSATMHAHCRTNADFRRLLAVKAGITSVELPTIPQRLAAKPAKPEPITRPACVHLGRRQLPPADPLGVACGCPGREVWACDVHGRCTRSIAFEGVACCRTCNDYEADAGPWVRHLAYHVYPVGGNGSWQRNVDHLCRRLDLIDGRIVVAVAYDPPTGRKPDPIGPHAPDTARHLGPCDPIDVVMDRFGPHAKRIEFIQVENDPELREVVSLVPMLQRMPHGPRDVMLYGQAKGTTRAAGHVSQHWADVLYELYLDGWPLVAELLEQYPVVGAFKKYGPGWVAEQSHSDWHYSGSWFWVRLQDLFARDWLNVDQFWSGIEPYPSQLFEQREAGVIFGEGPTRRLNLYQRAYWRRIEPELQKWRREHARHRHGA